MQGPAGCPATVVLCGESDLCQRYAKALQAYGLPAP